MRKRHQAFNISLKAKREINNYLKIDNIRSEEELKESLKNFFFDKIKEEDVENEEEDLFEDDNNILEFETPKKHDNVPQTEEFKISENAIISNFQSDIFKLIKNDDKKEKINFSDFIKELSEDDIKNIKIEELINVDENKLLDLENKLNELKDVCEENKNTEICNIIDYYIQEVKNKRDNMNYFTDNLDKIDTISFEKNGNIITFK
jgi:ferritin